MVLPSNQLAFRLNPTAHMRDKWIVDLFCGAGGASRGIERALGRSPDLCVNHSPLAIRNHEYNHPASRHAMENVWDVEPRDAVQGHEVGLLWASPDCTYFSRAKGGKPIRFPGKRVRILADIVVKWAKQVHPDVMFVENVMEFTKWGPLIVLCDSHGRPVRKDGKLTWVPDKSREREYFVRWVRSLERLGYQVEWKQLKCSDYGAPTQRRRLFVIARRDGKQIRWPRITHGSMASFREQVAADCIDFNKPIKSIWHPGRRPLKPATLRRCAVAAIRYMKNNQRPYILTLTHGGRLEPIDEPMRTITGANRGEKALVQPRVESITRFHGEKRKGGVRAAPVDQPLPTQTTENRFGLVEGKLSAAGIMTNNTGHPGQDIRKPLNTSTTTQHHALVEGKLSAAAMARIGQTGGNGKYANSVEEPVTTITTKAEHVLVAGSLVQTGYGERKGQAPRALDIEKPIGALVDGQKHALVTATLIKNYGGVVGQPVDNALGTITTVDHHSLVTSNLAIFHGTGKGATLDLPMPVNAAGGGHIGLETATLIHYYSSGGQDQSISEPIHTIVSRDRHALLVGKLGHDLAGAIRVGAFLVEYGDFITDAWLEVEGIRYPVCVMVIRGLDYLMVDLCLRMLQPDELKLAQGFDRDYHLVGTKAEQVKLIGNSVPPQAAEALVRANLLEQEEEVPLEAFA